MGAALDFKMKKDSYQKTGTCRIMRIPKGVYDRKFYEVRCKKKKSIHTADTTTLKKARSVAKKMSKKHNIKKIYEEI